jgi:hypothetical protein
MNPWKLDSPIYEIGQSDLVWIDKTLLENLRTFWDNLRTRIGLKQEIKIHFKDKAHLGWEILKKGILIWTTIRIFLSPRNLGPTPWIGIWEDKKLEERSREDLENMWSWIAWADLCCLNFFQESIKYNVAQDYT